MQERYETEKTLLQREMEEMNALLEERQSLLETKENLMERREAELNIENRKARTVHSRTTGTSSRIRTRHAHQGYCRLGATRFKKPP